ncbi:MAG: hypothetical protein M3Y35_07740 [Actinomycetota bacterium]|nr:hypothetical protein [Actinomycetota bacterium]
MTCTGFAGPTLETPTTTPDPRATAGVRALPFWCESARTQNTRRSSASASTAVLTSRSGVVAKTSQLPATSPGR